MDFSIVSSKYEHIVATHKAAFVISGLYSKGPSNSFALPTHKPIMVLGDPSGGLSYATYTDVQTTIDLQTSTTSESIANTISMDFTIDFGAELKKSTGLGDSVENNLLDMEFKPNPAASISRAKTLTLTYVSKVKYCLHLEKTRSTQFTMT